VFKYSRHVNEPEKIITQPVVKFGNITQGLCERVIENVTFVEKV
jgi:hypothetical protein